MKKDKAISLRLPTELYEVYVQKALDKSNKEKRIVNVSEIIRDILEENK